MITITVTSDALAKKAHEIMQNEIMRDVNLNGAEYRVIFGDFDTIDGADEYVACSLYAMIFTQNGD